jgi:hypothetical protein
MDSASGVGVSLRPSVYTKESGLVPLLRQALAFRQRGAGPLNSWLTPLPHLHTARRRLRNTFAPQQKDFLNFIIYANNNRF